MSEPVSTSISQEDFERVISQAAEQYEVYVALAQVASVLNYQMPVEDYHRDLSHPLSIQLKG